MMVRIIAIAGLLAAAVLILVINTTSPTTVGPLGILTVFFCIYVVAVACLTLGFFFGSRFLARLLKSVVVRRPLQPMKLSRAYYFSSIIALAPVMLIGMQSVGSAGLSDIILVLLFVVIGVMYTAKRTA
jgi:hypothetical protein